MTQQVTAQKIKLIVMTLGMTLTLCIPGSKAFAAENKCDNINLELKAMQRALHQLFESHNSKNKLLSETMSQQYVKLEKILRGSHRISEPDIQELRLSAKSFQGHEKRESRLIQRFETASSQLFDQVQVCISSKPELVTAK